MLSTSTATFPQGPARVSGLSLTLPLLAMVVPISVGLWAEGTAATLSLLIGVLLPTLVSTSFLGATKGRLVAPVAFAALFVASILLLPFNSLAFLVDAGTTLVFALLTIPRGRLVDDGDDEEDAVV